MKLLVETRKREMATLKDSILSKRAKHGTEDRLGRKKFSVKIDANGEIEGMTERPSLIWPLFFRRRAQRLDGMVCYLRFGEDSYLSLPTRTDLGQGGDSSATGVDRSGTEDESVVDLKAVVLAPPESSDEEAASKPSLVFKNPEQAGENLLKIELVEAGSAQGYSAEKPHFEGADDLSGGVKDASGNTYIMRVAGDRARFVVLGQGAGSYSDRCLALNVLKNKGQEPAMFRIALHPNSQEDDDAFYAVTLVPSEKSSEKEWQVASKVRPAATENSTVAGLYKRGAVAAPTKVYFIPSDAPPTRARNFVTAPTPQHRPTLTVDIVTVETDPSKGGNAVRLPPDPATTAPETKVTMKVDFEPTTLCLWPQFVESVVKLSCTAQGFGDALAEQRKSDGEAAQNAAIGAAMSTVASKDDMEEASREELRNYNIAAATRAANSQAEIMPKSKWAETQISMNMPSFAIVFPPPQMPPKVKCWYSMCWEPSVLPKSVTDRSIQISHRSVS